MNLSTAFLSGLMPIAIVGVILLVIIVTAKILLLKTQSNFTSQIIQEIFKKKEASFELYSYKSRKFLCTPAELEFFRILEKAIRQRYRIFSKVRFADVVEPNEHDWRSTQSAFNKISRKHLDFVLCDLDALKIIAAIELDDRSHNRTDRQERDKFVDTVLQEASVPIIRFKVNRKYSVKETEKKILKEITTEDGPNSEVIDNDDYGPCLRIPLKLTSHSGG